MALQTETVLQKREISALRDEVKRHAEASPRLLTDQVENASLREELEAVEAAGARADRVPSIKIEDDMLSVEIAGDRGLSRESRTGGVDSPRPAGDDERSALAELRREILNGQSELLHRLGTIDSRLGAIESSSSKPLDGATAAAVDKVLVELAGVGDD